MSYPILNRTTMETERKGLLRKSRMREIPARRDGVIHVFRVDGQLTTGLTAGDMGFGNLTEIIEVDAREQDVTVSLGVPSSEDTFAFTVDARIITQVAQAIVAVASGIDNIAPVVTREVEKVLRSVGRKYRIDKAATCEQAMREALSALGAQDGALDRYGMSVTDIFVKISLDKGAQQHQALLIEEDRKRELIRARYQTNSLEEELQRESMGLRANFWLERIAGGEPALVAMMLARGERQVQDVISDLRAAELTKLQLAHQTMQSLIASDKLGDWDLQTPARTLLAEMGKVIQEKTFDSRKGMPAGLTAAGEIATTATTSTTSEAGIGVTVGADLDS